MSKTAQRKKQIQRNQFRHLLEEGCDFKYALNRSEDYPMSAIDKMPPKKYHLMSVIHEWLRRLGENAYLSNRKKKRPPHVLRKTQTQEKARRLRQAASLSDKRVIT